ncbi:MAG: DMT family transporter [Silicimonas sp.]|nr:DMT family transporter [Silicimonas sp.]
MKPKTGQAVLKSANMQGAALMTVSMAAFTVNDTFFKLLGDHLPFFQVLFLRSVGVMVLMVGLAYRMGAVHLPTSRPDRWLIAFRTLAEVAAAYFFLTALVHLPIANVTAIIMALPLTVTLGAALFLGEPVGWRRLLAIAIGLFGVLLILRPGGADFTIYSVYAVLAVLFVTVRDLSVRRISAEVPSLTVALAAVIGILGFSAVGAVSSDWSPMAPRDIFWLIGSMVFILGGYLFSVMAMRFGEVAFVTPFRYSGLMVALLIGLLVFDDWPDGLTLLGAAIVVLTGLFTFWREQHAN